MIVHCPACKTAYDMSEKMHKKNSATVVCNQCYRQFEIIPGTWKNFYKPKVLLRNG